MIYLLRVLLFIWCLPQNIVGFLFVKLRRGEKYVFSPASGKIITKKRFIKFVRWIRKTLLKNEYYFIKDKKGVKNYGVSLGNYICMCTEDVSGFSNNDIQHENGHRVQSVLLGPFYLIFIGLSSLCNFIYNRIIISKKYDNETSRKKYHEFFSESWADKLGSC